VLDYQTSHSGGNHEIHGDPLPYCKIKVLTDYRTWFISLIVISTNVPHGAISSFSSIIIPSFGFDDYQTLLLNLPGAAIAFISVAAATRVAGRYSARGFAIIALVVPTMIVAL